MALYKVVDETKFEPFSRKDLPSESAIHDWVERNPQVLMEDKDLMVIGREVANDAGSIDLLCLNEDGDLVIIELKKGKTPREVIAQALDYLSSVDTWDRDRLEAIAVEYFRKTGVGWENLEAAFFEKFSADEAESEERALPKLNRRQHVLIAAEDVTSAVERMARFLVKKGVPVSCVEFTVYSTEAGETLVDVATIVSPDEDKEVENTPLTEEQFRDKAHPVAVQLRKALQKARPGGGQFAWRTQSCVYQIPWRGKFRAICVVWLNALTLYHPSWLAKIVRDTEVEERLNALLAGIPGLAPKLENTEPGCAFGEGTFEEKHIGTLVQALTLFCDAVKRCEQEATEPH